MRARAHLLALLAAALLALAAAPAARAALPTECWLIAARLDSGDQLLFEITITDAGPGERNAAAVGHWATPDGKLLRFQKAKLGGQWTSAAGGRVMDLEKLRFDRSGPQARLHAEKRSIRIVLDFPLPSRPIIARRMASDRWLQELWTGAAPVSAELWAAGRSEVKTRGLVAVSHREIDGGEAKSAQRRGEAFSLAPGPSLYIAEIAAATRAERWVVALDAQGRVLADALEPAGAQADLRVVPVRLALATPPARGELRAGARLAEYDPLDDLPGPVKFLLGLRLRSAWMSSPFDVRVQTRTDVAPVRLQGTALASYTFYSS